MPEARRERELASIRSIRFSTTRIVPNTMRAMDSSSSATHTVFSIRSIRLACLLALKMAELAADAIHDAFNHDDFSAERLGQYQAKLDRGIESMRKLVYAFYNDGFSFAGFLRKYPEERVHIINLLIGDVFKEGVDSVYGPMSEFAEIPPPLYEQVDGTMVPQVPTAGRIRLLLSAKYKYFDDRVAAPESGD